MRRRPAHRHPVIETAVFAAALLLAAFIARELWSRRAPAHEAPGPVQAAKLSISYPPLPSAQTSGRTESAVTAVPPVKLSKVQSRRLRTEPVPAPR